MPANNPLDEVTFDHITEACPKMTRRLRAGPAAEFMVWLHMHHSRAQEHYDRLPKVTGPATDAWATSMRVMLRARKECISILIAATADKFPTMEWNHARDAVWRMFKDAEAAALPLTQFAPAPDAPDADQEQAHE